MHTLAVSTGAKINMPPFLNCRLLYRQVLDSNTKDYAALIAACGRSLQELSFGYRSMPSKILNTVRMCGSRLERLTLSLGDINKLLLLAVGGTLRTVIRVFLGMVTILFGVSNYSRTNARY